MPWNYLQAEILPADHLIRPMIGPGDLTRQQAHAEIQELLDRVPMLTEVAETWRRGAKDDTVYHGPFIWAIYEYPDDPRAGAIAWIEEIAEVMRSTTGMDVQVAKLP